MSVTIQLRRDVAANWSAVNPILAIGEIGIDTTNMIFKIGDGVLHWNTLTNFPVMSSATDISGYNWVLDEDDMISDSDIKVPTQQSVKAYVSTTSLNRANHTGTQLASTISDFDTAVDLAGATLNNDTNISANLWVLDEDDMISDSATQTVTQQSVKKYIDKHIDILKTNISINAFRIIEQSGLSVYNMVDGFSDSYEDQNGVDLVNSVNQVYVDIDNYYGNIVLYDILNISHDIGHDFDASSILSAATEIIYTPDGSRCFVLTEAAILYQLDLGTSWENDTAVYNSVNIDISAFQTLTEGFCLNSNGDKLFVVDQNVRNIGEYVMTIPWELSTLTPTGITFSINAQDARPTDIFISDIGTELYIVGNASDAIYKYDLATANDLSTISYGGVNHTLSSNTIESFSFNDDGTKLFTLDNNGDLQQYSMAVGYDIANLVYDSILVNTNPGAFQPHGMFIKPDGTKLYTININEDIIRQYAITKSSTDLIELESLAVTALAMPDTCFVVFEDKYIDADLITDIQIYVSRDDGNTWTIGSLNKVCDLMDNHRISTATIDVSAQPVGTDIRYKITTTNNKKVEFHAISLQWS